MGNSDQPPVDLVMRCVKIGAFCAVMVPVLSFVISWTLFPANDDNGKPFLVPSLIWETIVVSVILVPFGIWIGAIVGDVLKHRRDKGRPQ